MGGGNCMRRTLGDLRIWRGLGDCIKENVSREKAEQQFPFRGTLVSGLAVSGEW